MKIGNEKIRVRKNPLNRFWNWVGQMQNCPEILIEGQWYRCGIRFIERNGKKIAVIHHPMIVDEVTSQIRKIYMNGDFLEIEVSNFQKQILLYKMNHHKINDMYNNIRRRVRERRNTIIVFAIAIVPSLFYFELNEMKNNYLMTYIGSNNWIQTAIIFLTISSFLNIFYPFTIQKPIDEKVIREIIERTKEEDKSREWIEKIATI